MDEFQLIDHLQKRLGPKSPEDVVVGIGDDAAVLQVRQGEQVLLTTDSLVEDVHFATTTMSWFDVGYKAMAVSISDIAAMGGEPRHAVLSLVLPKDRLVLSELEQMYDGVSEICAQYKCFVVGGNVAAGKGPAVITSTVVGGVPAGTALLRSGARPGDVVFVTGAVGGSGAGLQYLQSARRIPGDDAQVLRISHQRPKPQVEAGKILRETGASSCNDISDGLASELNEIARASGVRLRIDKARVPILPAVRNFARMNGEDPLRYAFYGGEDYQLVGTASGFSFARALARMEALGIRLTQIGRVEPGDGVLTEGPGGHIEVLQPLGFNHLRETQQATAPLGPQRRPEIPEGRGQPLQDGKGARDDG